MPRLQLPDGSMVEVPDTMPPDQLDAMLAELTGQPARNDDTMPDRASRLAPAGREGESDVDYAMRVGDQTWGEPVLPGLTRVGAAAGPIRQLLGRLAPGLMRNALGAQQSIRSKFPTVDLEKVALREGAIPGSAKSIAAVQQAARAAGSAVNQAADNAPLPARVSRKVLLSALRPLHQQARMAADTDAQQAITARMRQVAGEIDDAGLSMREGQARKQLLAQRGKAARTSGNPKDAAIGPQMADAERKAIAGVQRSAGGMAPALDRSQELMALEKAMTRTGQRTSLLRDALAAATGTGAGLMTGNPLNALMTVPAAVALNRSMTSPQTLGRLAQLLNRTGQTPSPGQMEALIAQVLGTANAQE